VAKADAVILGASVGQLTETCLGLAAARLLLEEDANLIIAGAKSSQ
jgi:hypothetical protein